MNKESVVPSQEPTKAQKKVLEKIRKLTAANGYPPSIEEIAKSLKRSGPTVYAQILILERDGWIARTPGKYRSIQVLSSPNPELVTA